MRQPSTTDVVFFPLDNSPALTREFAHETNANWVFTGTPAGGLAIHGFLLQGLTVVARPRNEEHGKQIYNNAKARLVEELVEGQSYFGDPNFVMRAAVLRESSKKDTSKKNAKTSKNKSPKAAPLDLDLEGEEEEEETSGEGGDELEEEEEEPEQESHDNSGAKTKKSKKTKPHKSKKKEKDDKPKKKVKKKDGKPKKKGKKSKKTKTQDD